HVDDAPAAGEALAIRAAVARGATVVDVEHADTAAREERGVLREIAGDVTRGASMHEYEHGRELALEPLEIAVLGGVVERMNRAERAGIGLRLGDGVHAGGQVDLAAAERAEGACGYVELPQTAGHGGTSTGEEDRKSG